VALDVAHSSLVLARVGMFKSPQLCHPDRNAMLTSAIRDTPVTVKYYMAEIAVEYFALLFPVEKTL